MEVKIYFSTSWKRWKISEGEFEGCVIPFNQKVRVELNGVQVEGRWIWSDIGQREWIEFESRKTKVYLTPGDSMKLELIETNKESKEG
jgi:hypothetical protein